MPGPRDRTAAMEFLDWMEQELSRTGLTIAEVARRSGVNEGTIHKARSQRRAMQRSSREAIRRVFARSRPK